MEYVVDICKYESYNNYIGRDMKGVNNMEIKEFQEVTALLNKYIKEYEEDYEYEGFSNHHSHLLHFYEKRPQIGMCESLYEAIMEYVGNLIMEADKEDVTITELNQASLKKNHDCKHWSIFLEIDKVGNVVGYEGMRFKNCRIVTYEPQGDSYEPIIIRYNSHFAIERKGENYDVIASGNRERRFIE